MAQTGPSKPRTSGRRTYLTTGQQPKSFLRRSCLAFFRQQFFHFRILILGKVVAEIPVLDPHPAAIEASASATPASRYLRHFLILLLPCYGHDMHVMSAHIPLSSTPPCLRQRQARSRWRLLTCSIRQRSACPQQRQPVRCSQEMTFALYLVASMPYVPRFVKPCYVIWPAI